MANISVNGWIAEGGCRIIEGKKNKIILFELIENIAPTGGITNDVYGTNKAWFHCSFEVDVMDTSTLSVIPPGYTLQSIDNQGWAGIVKEGSRYDRLHGGTSLYGEQVAGYIQEGKLVNVKGQEYLLEGSDRRLLRVINVHEIFFDPTWVREKPKLLTVPYKSDITFSVETPEKKEDSK